MGLGYLAGCFGSIICWKLERRKIIKVFDTFLCSVIPNSRRVEIAFIILIGGIIMGFKVLPQDEIINLITAFLVIDVSNTEKKNLNIGERTHFYDSISMISRSIVGGFTAPLFYILLLGNGFGIAYMIIFNLSNIGSYPLFKRLFNVLSIGPALAVQALLYGVYLARNRRFSIDFKRDYFTNCILRPFLNIDILGAYIESVNFYYCFSEGGIHYVKSYGEFTNKIDIVCVKDFLSIAYGTAMIHFLVFFFLLRIV